MFMGTDQQAAESSFTQTSVSSIDMPHNLHLYNQNVSQHAATYTQGIYADQSDANQRESPGPCTTENAILQPYEDLQDCGLSFSNINGQHSEDRVLAISTQRNNCDWLSISNGTDNGLPKYADVEHIKPFAVKVYSGPPPRYEELFAAGPGMVGGDYQYSNGLDTSPSPRRDSRRHPRQVREVIIKKKRRCCFGRVGDRECWFLAIGNGLVLVIILVAAYFARSH